MSRGYGAAAMPGRERNEADEVEIRRLRADAAQAEQGIGKAPIERRTLRRRVRRWWYRRRRQW